MPLELYGPRACPHTAEMRDELEWLGKPFVEYDVEANPAARDRMLAITGGTRPVPVIVVLVPGGVEAGLSARLLAMGKDEVVTLELVTPTTAMG